MSGPVNWQDLPSTATPITAANLLQMQSWVSDQAAAAQSSANAAAASAAAAAAPADDVVAGLVANGSSATTTQLAGRYQKPRPGLTVWRKARDAMATAPARILCLGDSITEGDASGSITARWSSVLSGLISARYGVPTSTFGHVTTYFNGATPNPFTKTNVSLNVSSWGPAASLAGTVTATTGTIAATVTGTSMDIYYVTSTGTGGFTVQVDGVAVGGTYGGTSATIVDGNKAHVAFGAGGSHTILITANSAGPLFITGIAVYNGNESAGLQMFNAGSSGAQAALFSAPVSGVQYWQQAVNAVAPHLVIVLLAANDYASATSLPTFQSNADLILSNIRSGIAAQPQPSILLLTPPKIAYTPSSPAQWQTYIHALRTAAKKDGSAEFFDLGSLMPDIGSAAGNASGYYNAGELTHPNASGHARIAQILDEVLADVIVS